MDDSRMPNTVGFPADSAVHDSRVILTPDVARELRDEGFRVLSEPGIGGRIGIADDELLDAGVEFTATDVVWTCPLLLKYKAFTPEQLDRLRPGQSIGAVFHAEGDARLISALCAAQVTAYSYEFLVEGSTFPLMRAGGYIAGVQSVLSAAQHLQTTSGGRGILLANVPGVPDGLTPRVLVIGTGNVGSAAAKTAAALGADVIALTHTEQGREQFVRSADYPVHARVNSPLVLGEELPLADVVIGAILVSTYSTPAMVTEDDLTRMKPGAVIVDATCGYGPGYLPTAGPTQQPGDQPHVVHGVLHVKVDVLPSLVPVTASFAYAANATPHLVRLAHMVLNGRDDPVVRTALIVADGQVRHPVVAEHADFYQNKTA